MKPVAQNTKTPSKNKWRLIFISLIVALFSIAAITTYFVFRPAPAYPLGDRLEYLGEEETGCYGFCDSLPSWTYYYGTDMSPEEVASYFTTIRYEIDPMSTLTTIRLDMSSTNKSVYLYYYKDKKASEPNLRPTTKKHLITIDSEDYQAAKDSL